MAKFKETRDRIFAESGGENAKKIFNESYFNELSTALLNDPEYEKIEMVTKKGELSEMKTTPIADLRKTLIGSVAKAAGCDAAEREKLVAEHQFPTLPMYDYVDCALQEYMGLGKKFTFSRKEDFKGSIELCEQKACVKEVKAPGSDVSKKQRQGEYKKLKAKSTCPDNLKTYL